MQMAGLGTTVGPKPKSKKEKRKSVKGPGARRPVGATARVLCISICLPVPPHYLQESSPQNFLPVFIVGAGPRHGFCASLVSFLFCPITCKNLRPEISRSFSLSVGPTPKSKKKEACDRARRTTTHWATMCAFFLSFLFISLLPYQLQESPPQNFLLVFFPQPRYQLKPNSLVRFLLAAHYLLESRNGLHIFSVFSSLDRFRVHGPELCNRLCCF
jgi:hypothetical protein